MAGRGAGKALVVGAAASLALTACSLHVHVPDKNVYRDGFRAGIQAIQMGAPNVDDVVHDCSLTADEMAKQFGWDSDTRLDFMLGCQDSAHGRKNQYP